MEVRPGREAASRLLVPLLVSALVLGSVAVLLITRELRRSDDVVSSVKVTSRFSPAAGAGIDVELSQLSPFLKSSARIRFDLTNPDRDVVVEVIDSDQAVTRALAEGSLLAAGTHRFKWDGRTETGALAPVGRYRLRIALGEQNREVFPRGTIRVEYLGGG